MVFVVQRLLQLFLSLMVKVFVSVRGLASLLPELAGAPNSITKSHGFVHLGAISAILRRWRRDSVMNISGEGRKPRKAAATRPRFGLTFVGMREKSEKAENADSKNR